MYLSQTVCNLYRPENEVRHFNTLNIKEIFSIPIDLSSKIMIYVHIQILNIKHVS